jgi:P-loop containing dynein motor region D4
MFNSFVVYCPQDSFLEDVSSILNTGEIPDLFDSDEFENIAMELKSALAEAQIPETFQAVYQFFFQVRYTCTFAFTL